ncbi:hypothetical protein IJG73_01350 [Candidatus Saccharibacteria bacterium]|nr:hypothetical protein [Candidatus Saccharibacteria bacterium]
MKIERARARQVKKVAVTVILIAAVAVAGSLWCNYYFSPAERAGRELEKLTKDYYENFFYDLVLKEGGEGVDLAELFAPYEKGGGMQPVLLRQLLLFDSGRHESSRKEFINDSYRCDTNTTSVRIKPTAPYGRNDWTAEYNLSCTNG